MIINTNMASLNTLRQLGNNEKATQGSLAKLSSGLRINSAADDAAGLAISEKMRGQISGLNKASSNAQDGISMVATAEGSLNETTSILQRMRELAVQAGNDTSTTTDRTAMQTEMNQLTSEVNRIGNTTEFNTQKLLQGDGKVDLSSTKLVVDGNLTSGLTNRTEATQTFTATANAVAGDTATFTINGQALKMTFTATASNGGAANDSKGYGVTANSANVAAAATATATTTGAGVADALQKMIDSNATLKGNYTAVMSGAGLVTITAVTKAAGGNLDGDAGNIAAASTTGTLAHAGTDGLASVGKTTFTQASKATAFASLNGATGAAETANIKALAGTGMTINGKEVEFYNADNGVYTGSAIGVNISAAANTAWTATGDQTAALVKNIAKQLSSNISGVVVSQDATTATTLNITADSTQVAEAGNALVVKDGGVQKDFQATFQIGANTNQTMTVAIKDMRSQALDISGTTSGATITASNGSIATLTAVQSASDGTSSTNTEYTLDLSSAAKATAAVSVIDDATAKVSAERSNLGAVQNRLEHTINNLGTSSQNITTAEANIRDVDMAKEMTNFQKNNILQQAAQSMLAQANQQGQGVLKLLQ